MEFKTYQEVLDFAVKNEIEAYEFYKAAAEKVTNQGAKTSFEKMAKEEQKHRELLEQYTGGASRELHFEGAPDYKVSEQINKVELNTDMNYTEALAVAMKNEQDAMEMYNKLASLSKDGEQKDLFSSLATMEQEHKNMLESLYTNASSAEAW